MWNTHKTTRGTHEQTRKPSDTHEASHAFTDDSQSFTARHSQPVHAPPPEREHARRWHGRVLARSGGVWRRRLHSMHRRTRSIHDKQFSTARLHVDVGDQQQVQQQRQLADEQVLPVFVLHRRLRLCRRRLLFIATIALAAAALAAAASAARAAAATSAVHAVLRHARALHGRPGTGLLVVVGARQQVQRGQPVDELQLLPALVLLCGRRLPRRSLLLHAAVGTTHVSAVAVAALAATTGPNLHVVQ